MAQELGPATNLSAVVNVTIYINDVNDNLPVFEQEVYVAEVPENMTAGTKIVQVRECLLTITLYIEFHLK